MFLKFHKKNAYIQDHLKIEYVTSLILHMVKSSPFLSLDVYDMSKSNEQRVCTEFCLKLGENATEMYEMIKTAFRGDF